MGTYISSEMLCEDSRERRTRMCRSENLVVLHHGPNGILVVGSLQTDHLGKRSFKVSKGQSKTEKLTHSQDSNLILRQGLGFYSGQSSKTERGQRVSLLSI